MQPPDLLTYPANANIDLRPVLSRAAERYSLGLTTEPRRLAAAFIDMDHSLVQAPHPKLTVIDGGRTRPGGICAQPEPA
jgi:hypothetical protein